MSVRALAFGFHRTGYCVDMRFGTLASLRGAGMVLALLSGLLLTARPVAFAQDAINTATIAPPAGTTDPDGSNDSASDSDPIVQVSTRKSSDPASGQEVEAGSTIEYVLSVDVTGGPLPTDVVLTDTLSVGQTLVPGSLPSSCNSAPGAGGTTVVTCVLAAGSLPAGNPHSFTYRTTVDLDATGSVGNNVVPNVGDCTSCSTEHPVADPTVTYNKAADTAGPVSVGDAITYTLTATVSASQLTTDLVLTDTLGTGLTFGTVTAAGDFTPDTSGAPVLTFTLPAGTVPGTYTVSYTATVNDQAAGQVSNAVVGDQGTCDVDCDIEVPVA